MGVSVSTTSANPTMATAKAGAVSAYRIFNEVHVEREFKKGDILEVPRGVGCHWMLYIGNSEVAHISVDPVALACCCAGYTITDAFIPIMNASGVCHNIYKSVVKVSKIYDILKDTDVVRVNNKEYLGNKANMEPFSPEETVKRALDMKGKTVDYQLQDKNCEYYVTSWKYENAENLLSAVSKVDGIGKSIGRSIYNGLVKLGKLTLWGTKEE